MKCDKEETLDGPNEIVSYRLPPRPRLRIYGATGRNRMGEFNGLELLPVFDKRSKAVPDMWIGFAYMNKGGRWIVPKYSTEQILNHALKRGWTVRVLD